MLEEYRSVVPSADGRRYERRVVAAARSGRPRGLDRQAPVRVDGATLRAARRSAGESVGELARRTGVSRATWSHWEASGLPAAYLGEVAEAFGIPGGPAIRQQREAAGWTQAALGAEMGGVSGVFVGSLEQGRASVPAGRVPALLAALARARDAASRLLEDEVARLVERVRREPGVSEATLLHEHTWSAGGERRVSPRFAAALEEAKARRLVEEGSDLSKRSGPQRKALYLLGCGPRRSAPMTGAEVARERERLGLTRAELARLCQSGPLAVLSWERRGREELSDRVSERLRAGLAAARRLGLGRRAEDVAARERVLAALGDGPLFDSRLKRVAGEAPAVRRQLEALQREGKVVRALLYDSLGRQFRGWWLAGEVRGVERPAGRVLADQRKQAGWTQRALAEELGVEGRTVWRWENDRGRIPPRHLAQFRAATARPAPERSPRASSSENAAVAVFVRSVRLALGLSQPRFAAALGVATSTVSGWENGARVPPRRLEQICALQH